MKYPNFNEEKKLWKQGYKFVVGLDEVGRGPLAGPVVASAIIINLINKKHSDILQNVRMFLGIKDSKKLSEKQREEFYEILTKHSAIRWGIGIVSEKVIDKINILEATKLAMVRAIASLISNFQFPISKSRQSRGLSIESEQIQKPKSKIIKVQNQPLQKIDGRQFSAEAGFLLIDGNFGIDSTIPQKSIIKGDEKVFSISAASIIAKVTRDRIMQKMDKKYPQYGFAQHKGYGTELHIKNLKKFGHCKIHRKTFEPIKSRVYSKSLN